MLYCAAADGCTPVLHDFASSETSVTHSAGAETNASACLVIAPAERGAKASAPSALSARTVGAAAAEGAEGTANAAAAEGEAAPATPFTGHFADSNHPGCPRSISANATAAAVSGEDENGQPWTVRASIASNTTGPPTILVDFSPKGGPKALEGTWTGTSIEWTDGNSCMPHRARTPD